MQRYLINRDYESEMVGSYFICPKSPALTPHHVLGNKKNIVGVALLERRRSVTLSHIEEVVVKMEVHDPQVTGMALSR